VKRNKKAASKERIRREQSGRRAEVWACWYLRLKGYQILEHRYKTRHGEIDILARKKHALIVIEVKFRKTLKAAEDSISYKARKRIERATEDYVSRNRFAQKLAIRFDGIFVIQNTRALPKIKHLQDLWRVY